MKGFFLVVVFTDPLGRVSHRVAMSICMCFCPLPVIFILIETFCSGSSRVES